jgi:hypothetical protein
VTLFAGFLIRTIRVPREPYLGFILAGTLWFWLGATARLALSVVTVGAEAIIPPAALNSAYLHAMSWGFLTSFVIGYSLRLLPAFTGLPAAAPRPAWAALAALSLGTTTEVIARVIGAPLLSAAAVAVSAVGVLLTLTAIRIWTPDLAPEDREAAWLARFARAAYFWLVVATVILCGQRIGEALMPVSPLLQHAFGGASRHALTVGFISLMIVGVAWRILPIFSGAERVDPRLMPLVFGLLLTGNTMRVTGQMAAGLWGGPWYALMGLSGWLETFGIVLFALDVLRLLGATPEGAALPDAGGPVELSLQAPVGPLVAHRPWLVPVFARHGLETGLQPALPADRRTASHAGAGVPSLRRRSRDPPAGARGRGSPAGSAG